MADPLSLPASIGFQEFDLQPVRTRDAAAMEGRRTETVDSATPFWTLKARTQPCLNAGEVEEVDAWLMEASDGGQCFLAYDYSRPRPSAYGAPLSGTRAGGGAFDGTATLDEVTSPREATISGLPAGFVINRGANIGFRRSALIRSLHRVMEAATADGSGIAVVKFRYGLNPLFEPEGTTVDLEKPACIMLLDPGFTFPKARADRTANFTAQEAFFS